MTKLLTYIKCHKKNGGNKKKGMENERKKNKNQKKVASDLHRTATTAYLCCVPTLEDFAGAGRVGLAGANIPTFFLF